MEGVASLIPQRTVTNGVGFYVVELQSNGIPTLLPFSRIDALSFSFAGASKLQGA